MHKQFIIYVKCVKNNVRYDYNIINIKKQKIIHMHVYMCKCLCGFRENNMAHQMPHFYISYLKIVRLFSMFMMCALKFIAIMTLN